MAKMIIIREKTFMGCAAPMYCYVNDTLVFILENGKTNSWEVDGVVSFMCSLNNNNNSNTILMDLSNIDSLEVRIKPTITIPQIVISNDKCLIKIEAIANPIAESLSSFLGVPQKNTTAKAIIPFSPTKIVGKKLKIDENSKQWAIDDRNKRIYSFDDILKFELLENGYSITKRPISSAIVGGLLFSKQETKEKCNSLKIKIAVNNINSPVEYIELLDIPCSKSSLMYELAFNKAQEILSVLEIITNQRDQVSDEKAYSCSTSSVSAVDEIRKYKALLDDGIITEEEFLLKKKQLLDL